MLPEKPLTEPLSFTFYTYSPAGIPLAERWARTGIPDIFFDDCDEARRAVMALRDDVMADPEVEWPTMILEKIETTSVTRSSVLALLNNGPGAFIANYQVIETIGPKA